MTSNSKNPFEITPDIERAAAATYKDMDDHVHRTAARIMRLTPEIPADYRGILEDTISDRVGDANAERIDQMSDASVREIGLAFLEEMRNS